MLSSEQLKVPHFLKSFAHTGPWLHLPHKRLVHRTSIYCVWGISFVCLKEASGNLSWCLQTEKIGQRARGWKNILDFLKLKYSWFISRTKANRVLPRECTDHSEHLFQQHKRWFHTWTSPDGQYWNQIDYILCSQRWKSSVQSAKTRPEADCGSDHQLFIEKFRLNWKKVWKTTRLFSSVQFSCSVVSDSLRPHESQHARPPCPTPTPGVHSDSHPSSQWCHPAISSSVVKQLDLIECLKSYGWRFVTLYRRWWSKPSPRKRNPKRQNGCLRRTYK